MPYNIPSTLKNNRVDNDDDDDEHDNQTSANWKKYLTLTKWKDSKYFWMFHSSIVTTSGLRNNPNKTRSLN